MTLFFSRIRITARAVTLLPQPDSPHEPHALVAPDCEADAR